MSRTAFASALSFLLLAGTLGCDDGEQKRRGTISFGATPTGSAVAPRPTMVRLVVAPGSPLSTQPVAEALRARLEPIGVEPRQVEIAGEDLHVYVPKSLEAKAEEAVAGGRVDLFVYDGDSRQVAEVDASPPMTLQADALAGSRARHLVVPAAERDRLVSVLDDKGEGLLLGPLYDGNEAPQRYRSYPVVRGRSMRGELVTSARATDDDRLELTFTGAGKNFITWNTRNRQRIVLLVDGEVLATTLPSAPIEDGVLTFDLERRGTADHTREAVERIARSLDGGKALSNEVKRATPGG